MIYEGYSECEENPVKVEVPKYLEAQGREHLAMVLQKFDWTKCLGIAILAKVNGKPVVAIVDTKSAGFRFSESCFERLGLKEHNEVNYTFTSAMSTNKKLRKVLFGVEIAVRKNKGVFQQ